MSKSCSFADGKTSRIWPENSLDKLIKLKWTSTSKSSTPKSIVLAKSFVVFFGAQWAMWEGLP